MGTDKSRHNGAAPKNSPRPQQRKHCRCSFAMETPPLLPAIKSRPLRSISAGSHGKDGTHGPQQGFKAVETSEEASAASPKRLLSQQGRTPAQRCWLSILRMPS